MLLFVSSLIHHLWLLGSLQHPQSGVPLTSFSIWGTENSLAEINLEGTGGDKKSCNIFWGQKLANTCSFVGGRIIVQDEKISEGRTQLDEPVECASVGYPVLLIKFCIYCFSAWYEFFVHHA